MGMCSAYGCRNSYLTGHKIFRFPKDPVRRKTWASKVKRENWTPNDNSRLCEVYFLVYEHINVWQL